MMILTCIFNKDKMEEKFILLDSDYERWGGTQRLDFGAIRRWHIFFTKIDRICSQRWHVVASQICGRYYSQGGAEESFIQDWWETLCCIPMTWFPPPTPQTPRWASGKVFQKQNKRSCTIHLLLLTLNPLWTITTLCTLLTQNQRRHHGFFYETCTKKNAAAAAAAAAVCVCSLWTASKINANCIIRQRGFVPGDCRPFLGLFTNNLGGVCASLILMCPPVLVSSSTPL